MNLTQYDHFSELMTQQSKIKSRGCVGFRIQTQINRLWKSSELDRQFDSMVCPCTFSVEGKAINSTRKASFNSVNLEGYNDAEEYRTLRLNVLTQTLGA